MGTAFLISSWRLVHRLFRLIVLVNDIQEASGAMGRDIISGGCGADDLLPLGALTNGHAVRIRSDAVLGRLLHDAGLVMLLERLQSREIFLLIRCGSKSMGQHL